MKLAINLRWRHYCAIVGIFLIIAALLAGMTGCDRDGSESYTLTISSTEGGNLTTPGEGTFTYDTGTVAEPE